MIKLIKSIYQRKLAEETNLTQALRSETRIMKEASQIVTDRPDNNGWKSMFQANDQEKGMLQATQLEMLRKVREFARLDPNAKAALSTLLNYVMGRGVSITPKADDPMVWYVWREFWTAERNKMDVKQFEIVYRSFRDGEMFIEFISAGDDGKNTGKATVRFVDPLLVRSKDDNSKTATSQTINNGIVTDPEDVEKVIEYTVQNRNNPEDFRTVPAKRMLHIKINADSDQKRGESQLLSIMEMIRHYQQWLLNRILLNKMRSAIVLVKKITGTPSEVASMAATLPTARNPAGTEKKQNIRGGTIITAGPGVEYEMINANINANDVKEDGRNIKLNMAAGTNLPEYVFGDASNANYSSSLIAESPFVKAVQFWQVLFQYHFGAIFRKVIEIAVDGGVLEAPDDEEFINQLRTVRNMSEAGDPVPPKKGDAAGGDNPDDAEDPADPKNPADTRTPKQKALAELMPNGKMETPSETFFGCDMQWPEIVHRDIKLHTDALTEARQNGWIADSTAAAALGFDYSEEVRKQRTIEEEAAQVGNPLLGKQPGEITDDGNMDAEMQDTLNSMDPESRNQILNAKSPQDVFKIMQKQKAAAAKTAGGGNGDGE